MPRTLFISAAVLALAVCRPLNGAVQADPYLVGLELVEKGSLDEAFRHFARLKVDRAGEALPYFYTGLIYTRKQQYSEATAEFREALKRDPEPPEFSLSYADALQRLGRHAAAATALERFDDRSSLSELETVEMWLLSDLYFRLENYTSSLAVLDLLEEAGPQFQARYRRGQIDLIEGRFERSLAYFRESEGLTTLKGPCYYGAGLALHRLNRLEEARSEFSKALATAPNARDYVFHLADVELELGDARSALDRLLTIEPQAEEFPAILSSIAKAYRRLGERDKALEYAQKFQALQGEEQTDTEQQRRSEALVVRGAEKLGEGNVAEAQKLFAEAVRENPRNSRGHSYLVKIYLSSRLLDAAAPHLDALRRLEPEAFETHFLLADFAYQAGRFVDARRHGEQARSLRPDYGDLRNLLGNVYVELGELHLALDEYEAAVQLEPERSEFQLNLESLKRRIP